MLVQADGEHPGIVVERVLKAVPWCTSSPTDVTRSGPGDAGCAVGDRYGQLASTRALGALETASGSPPCGVLTLLCASRPRISST